MLQLFNIDLKSILKQSLQVYRDLEIKGVIKKPRCIKEVLLLTQKQLQLSNWRVDLNRIDEQFSTCTENSVKKLIESETSFENNHSKANKIEIDNNKNDMEKNLCVMQTIIDTSDHAIPFIDYFPNQKNDVDIMEENEEDLCFDKSKQCEITESDKNNQVSSTIDDTSCIFKSLSPSDSGTLSDIGSVTDKDILEIVESLIEQENLSKLSFSSSTSINYEKESISNEQKQDEYYENFLNNVQEDQLTTSGRGRRVRKPTSYYYEDKLYHPKKRSKPKIKLTPKDNNSIRMSTPISFSAISENSYESQLEVHFAKHIKERLEETHLKVSIDLTRLNLPQNIIKNFANKPKNGVNRKRTAESSIENKTDIARYIENFSSNCESTPIANTDRLNESISVRSESPHNAISTTTMDNLQDQISLSQIEQLIPSTIVTNENGDYVLATNHQVHKSQIPEGLTLISSTHISQQTSQGEKQSSQEQQQEEEEQQQQTQQQQKQQEEQEQQQQQQQQHQQQQQQQQQQQHQQQQQQQHQQQQQKQIAVGVLQREISTAMEEDFIIPMDIENSAYCMVQLMENDNEIFAQQSISDQQVAQLEVSNESTPETVTNPPAQIENSTQQQTNKTIENNKKNIPDFFSNPCTFPKLLSNQDINRVRAHSSSYSRYGSISWNDVLDLSGHKVVDRQNVDIIDLTVNSSKPILSDNSTSFRNQEVALNFTLNSRNNTITDKKNYDNKDDKCLQNSENISVRKITFEEYKKRLKISSENRLDEYSGIVNEKSYSITSCPAVLPSTPTSQQLTFEKNNLNNSAAACEESSQRNFDMPNLNDDFDLDFEFDNNSIEEASSLTPILNSTNHLSDIQTDSPTTKDTGIGSIDRVDTNSALLKNGNTSIFFIEKNLGSISDNDEDDTLSIYATSLPGSPINEIDNIDDNCRDLSTPVLDQQIDFAASVINSSSKNVFSCMRRPSSPVPSSPARSPPAPSPPAPSPPALSPPAPSPPRPLLSLLRPPPLIRRPSLQPSSDPSKLSTNCIKSFKIPKLKQFTPNNPNNYPSKEIIVLNSMDKTDQNSAINNLRKSPKKVKTKVTKNNNSLSAVVNSSMQAGNSSMQAGNYSIQAGNYSVQAGNYSMQAGNYSMQAGNSLVYNVFGNPCFSFLSDSCIKVKCKFNHGYVNANLVKQRLSQLNGNILSNAYNFMSRNYKLFVLYFPKFCEEYGERKDESKLISMVKHCEIYSNCLSFLKPIVCGLTLAGVPYAEAIEKVMHNASPKTLQASEAIDVFVELILHPNYVLQFLDRLESYRQNPCYRFKMDAIIQMAKICNQRKYADLIEKLINIIAYQVTSDELLNCKSDELYHFLTMVKSKQLPGTNGTVMHPNIMHPQNTFSRILNTPGTTFTGTPSTLPSFSEFLNRDRDISFLN